MTFQHPVADLPSLKLLKSPAGEHRAEEPRSGARVAHYTELDGAQGRGIFFRPQRYRRADLGSLAIEVEVLEGGRIEHCELVDLCHNGVAFAWPSQVPLEVGKTVERLAVRFDGHEAYRGSARVSSLRRDAERTIAGASLTDASISMEELLLLRDVKGRTSSEGALSANPPWRVAGQERFKARIAELRLFLEDAQAHFAELGASLPPQLLEDERESPARAALIEHILRSSFSNEVVQAVNAMDALARGASPEELSALREYPRRHLHGFLMQSPWMRRALEKPLGYPGDYGVMTSIYSDHFRGSSLFARVIDLALAWTPAAEAVRARKDLIKGRLGRLLEARTEDDPVRILAIAAGPAQEIFELLGEHPRLDRPLEIVLLDQDEQALGYSYDRLRRVVAARKLDQVRVVHLHDSIKRLLSGGSVPGDDQFDAVYASGLFDYLQTRSWVSLCRTLYRSVRPGGELFVGNMVPSNPSRFLMECHLDWFLLYREHAELLELGHRAAPTAELEILQEPTGVNPFVRLGKP